jgi:uncharacterized repeat protein (TIGR01451 family)
MLLGGVLVLAFLGMAMLLFVVPARADVITVIDTTLEDFNAGYLYHTGLTRLDDGEVQLLVVGLAGDWITDTNTTGLPALARHTAVYTREHIIVAGGRRAGSLMSDGVYYTTVDLYTHDLADWQPATSLPASVYPNGGVFWHASVIAHERVYILGGRDNYAATYDAVSFASINADGSLGSWQTTTPLPEGLYQLNAVSLHGRIYVIGGQTASLVRRDTIYMGEPDPATGQITEWTLLPTTFVHPTYGHMVATHEDKIYVMGGFHPGLPPGYVSPYTHVATVDPDTGQIGAWTRLTDMENNLFGGVGLALNGVLFTTGGAINNLVSPSDYVGTALIDMGGTIGMWGSTSVIAPPRFYHAAVHSHDGWLYVIHGNDGSGAIQDINRGATSGVGQQHAPDGTYTSDVISLGGYNKLKQLIWNTTIADPSIMTVTLRYRTKRFALDPWSDWSAPYSSSSAPGTITTTVALAGKARYFQYEAYLATDDTQQTPALNAVQLVYETPTYEVQIAKDADPAPGSTVYPGERITYTIDYWNTLDGITATNTILVDAPPQYTAYVPGSIVGPGADDSNPKQLSWNLTTLDPGEVGQVGFTVVISPELARETVLENIASINSDQGPMRWSNVVTHLVDIPYQIEVTQDAVPAPGSFVDLGSQIAYTIRLTNTGEIPVTNAVLTDTFDWTEDYTVISTLPNPDLGTTNIWSLGTLAIGETRQIEIVVQLADVLPNNWPVTNQADVNSDQGPGRRSAVVTHTTQYEPGTPLVDLVVTNLRMQPANPEAGHPVSFFVDVANMGDADAGAFWVELYVRPSPSDPPARANDHEGGFFPIGGGAGRLEYTWNPSGLASGMGATLSFPRPGYTWSDLPFPYPDTQYDVYVQVDVAANVPPDNAYWGIYPEDEEANNIVHLTYTTPPVDDGRIFLPLVAKH